MTSKIRLLVAASLVTTALLSVVFALLQPEFATNAEGTLANIADAGLAAELSALGFTVSQLPFLVAVVGVGAWLHGASPKLATVGTTLAVLGGFGHAVFGGAMLTQVLMADDVENRAAYAELADGIQSFPLLVPFMVSGLLGTVLGLTLLGVAHFRSKARPRWIGPALWGFVVVEFVGTALSEFATYLSGLLYLAAFSALAAGILRSTSARGGPATASAGSAVDPQARDHTSAPRIDHTQ